jgi:hypothetical protein
LPYAIIRESRWLDLGDAGELFCMTMGTSKAQDDLFGLRSLIRG